MLDSVGALNSVKVYRTGVNNKQSGLPVGDIFLSVVGGKACGPGQVPSGNGELLQRLVTAVLPDIILVCIQPGHSVRG